MRGLLFDEDTNDLVGHATLYDVDDGLSETAQVGGDSPRHREEDLDAFVEIMSHALASVAIYGIEKAAPHVRDWIRDKAVPAVKGTAFPAVKAVPQKVKAAPGKVKATLKRKSGTNASDDGRSVVETVISHDVAASSAANGQAVGVDVRGPVMSSTEGGQRLAQAVAAMAFAREQMRVLHDATIVDDEGPVELASSLNELSPQHLGEAIRLVLAANPRMLERSTSSAITASLHTGQLEVDLLPLGGAAPERKSDPRLDQS